LGPFQSNKIQEQINQADWNWHVSCKRHVCQHGEIDINNLVVTQITTRCLSTIEKWNCLQTKASISHHLPCASVTPESSRYRQMRGRGTQQLIIRRVVVTRTCWQGARSKWKENLVHRVCRMSLYKKADGFSCYQRENLQNGRTSALWFSWDQRVISASAPAHVTNLSEEKLYMSEYSYNGNQLEVTPWDSSSESKLPIMTCAWCPSPLLLF
jgi:hypothetical protein